MAIRYQYQPDEIFPASTIVDEDFWQNPVAPVLATFYRTLPLADLDEIIVATIGQPDEDFWVNWVNPVQATFYQKLPLVPDPEELPAGSLYGQPDEDFWDNWVNPVPTTLYQKLPLGDVEEIPAGSLYGQPDEDFWNNPVNPVQATFYQKLPLGDPEEIPAGSLYGQPDEDFWKNPVAPVLATFYRTLPLADLDEIIVATIGQPDEDFWLPNPQIAFTFTRFTTPDDDFVAPIGIFDEDFWNNPVLPVLPVSFAIVALADSDIQYIITFDEEFWQNPVVPVLAQFYQKLPLIPDPEEIPAGSLSISIADEDLWNNPVNPVQATFYQKLPIPNWDVEEIPAGSLYGQPDEDFWKNPVAPVQATFYQKLQLIPDPEEIPVSAFIADEHFWQNPVNPVPLSLYQKLPLIPDPEELPAGSLYGQPDEDFWVSWVNSVPATLYQKLPLADLDEIIVATIGQPDEDFWQNPVTPVLAQLYQKLPLIPDPEELPAGSLYGQPDEDFWVSWVNPIPLTLYQKLPIPNWDVEEIPAGNLISLTINPDEDFWQNSVTPTQATFYQKLPLGDPEEIPAGELIGPLLNPDPPILTTMWRLASNPLPEARYLHGSLLHNNFVYVASGQGDLNTPPTTVYTDVKVARLENAGQDVGQWKIANSFIGVRQGCGMVGWGNYVAILGGSNATASPTRTNTILVGQQNFDGTISSWTTQYMPIQLSQYGLVQANNGVYIIGGINQASNPVTSIYFAILNANGTIEKWHYLSDLPTPAIAQNSVAFTNDFMYVLSGNTLYYARTFDFMIGTWKSQTLNFSRTGQYLLVRDNKLIILGGNDGTNTTSSVKIAAIYGDGSVGQFFDAGALLSGAFTATTSTILTASQSTAAPREGFGLCLSGIQVGIFIPGNKMILLGGRNSNTVMSDVYVGTL